jgi:hypothetical protein
MQSIRYAHGSGASFAPGEEFTDEGALDHREATVPNRAVCEELLMSIYSTVADGSVSTPPPWGLGVDDKIFDQRDANAPGRAVAKELLKSIYTILGEKREGLERHTAQFLGAGDGKYFGFKTGQVVHWARRDEAFGQRCKVVGYSDHFEEPSILVAFRGLQYHCKVQDVVDEDPKGWRKARGVARKVGCLRAEVRRQLPAIDPGRNAQAELAPENDVDKEADVKASSAHGRAYGRVQRLSRVQRKIRRRLQRAERRAWFEADIASLNM